MTLVFVKSFTAKEGGLPKLESGAVYDAVVEDDNFIIKLEDGELIVDKNDQKGPRFDAEIVEITKENYGEFAYTREDASKVMDKFIKPLMVNAAKAIEEQQAGLRSHLEQDLETLSHDLEIIEALAGLTSHIVATMGDKYELSSEADITGLMRYSPHSAGFNIGNTLKYCRRYLSTGFDKSRNTEDLYKAIHYLLFEIISSTQANEK